MPRDFLRACPVIFQRAHKAEQPFALHRYVFSVIKIGRLFVRDVALTGTVT